MASGASTQVGKSSLPVLTKVPSAVRIRKNMDAWKKRSAGSAGSFAGSVAEAAMSMKFHGSTRRRGGRRTAANGATKDNASRARGQRGRGRECGARGFACEVGDGQRRGRSDFRERNCLRTWHARKLRNGYAKGLQRDGVVRDVVAPNGQHLQAERLPSRRSRQNFVEVSLQLSGGICAHGNRRKMPKLGNEHGRSRVRRLVFWQRRWRKQQCAAARIEQDGGSERDFLRCAFFAACGKQAGNTELARLAALCVAYAAAHREDSRQHASDVAIEHSVFRAVRDAQDRRGSVAADAGKRERIFLRARENSAVLRDDFLRSTLQIARAAVVAESRPQPQHFFLWRGCER